MNKLFKRSTEIAPGAVSWTIILLPFVGGMLFPLVTIYFVLLINVYALYKSLTFNYFFFVSYGRIQYWKSLNWFEKLKGLEDPVLYRDELIELRESIRESSDEKIVKLAGNVLSDRLPRFIKKTIIRVKRYNAIKNLDIEIKEIESVLDGNPNLFFDYKKIHHVVIIPFWKEGYSVLSETMDYLKNQSFPTKQIIICLGAEDRHPPALKVAEKIKENYKEYFYDIWITNHKLTDGEIVGKAANVNFAGRNAYKKIKDLGWELSDVLVTSCDCDSLIDKDYMSALTYKFALNPKRHQNIYAAPMQYTANYERLYPFTRTIAVINSLSNISKASREHHFMPVSTYSGSLKMYEDIGFWAVDVIPEDFHTFLKVLFKYGDDTRCVPIFLPTLADTAEGETLRKAMVNQYEQEKRWAWGASDHGWMLDQLRKNFSWYRLYRILNVFQTHYTWGFLGFLLYLGANIPPLVNPDFYYTVEGNNIRTASMLMLRVTLIPFIIGIILTYTMLNVPYRKEGKLKLLYTLFSWLTLPIVSLVMKNAPGLDSQTRLLTAKYMEYRLTEKPA